MLRALRGLGGTGVRIECVMGDDMDAFVTSAEVRDNYQAAQALQRINDVGNAFESYRFADITSHNYRGTDDNEVQIGTKACQFFPSAPAPIVRAEAPGGELRGSRDLRPAGLFAYHHRRKAQLLGRCRNYSYPLFVNTMPQACVRQRRLADPHINFDMDPVRAARLQRRSTAIRRERPDRADGGDRRDVNARPSPDGSRAAITVTGVWVEPEVEYARRPHERVEGLIRDVAASRPMVKSNRPSSPMRCRRATG